MKRLEEILPSLFQRLRTNTPETRWKCGLPFPMAPGRVAIIGGAPGAGKTTLAVQVVVEALRADPALRATIGNVEMEPEEIMLIQAARISGVRLTAIREGKLTAADLKRLEFGQSQLAAIVDRLAFNEKFGVEDILRDADQFRPNIMICDYIQRFRPRGKRTGRGSAQENIDAVLSDLRQVALNEKAFILCLSSLARSKDMLGQSGYSNAGIASFKNSGEIEFAVDDAYILDERDNAGISWLRCEKQRFGDKTNLKLRFFKSYGRFEFAGTQPDETLLPGDA
jgi:replicative DNA helicase